MLGIFNDAVPEIDENFDLRLANPTGGVVLGTRQSVTVNVLNNDNAHGLIGFAEVYAYDYYPYACMPCDSIWMNLHNMQTSVPHDSEPQCTQHLLIRLSCIMQ